MGQQLIEYWQRSNLNGLADNLHTKFLAYREPLRKLLYVLDANISKYADLIQALKNVDCKPKDLYLDKIDTKKSVIHDNLNLYLQRIERLLWQKLLNNRRLEFLKDVCEDCVSAIKTHLTSANSSK